MRYTILLLLIIYCSKIVTADEENNYIDLTWPFEKIYANKFIGVPAKEIRYFLDDLCCGGHGGTRLDAPHLFNSLGWKIGDIPLSRLFVRGIMIDLSEEVNVLYDKTLLLPGHLEAWVKEHGPIPNNSVLLVNFGWSQFYSNRPQYLGIDENNNLNFPGITSAAARWIVQSGKIVGVGTDTATLDPGARTSKYSAHTILNNNQIYALQNLKLPVLPDTHFMLHVMPLKNTEATRMPLRIIATTPVCENY